MVAATEDEALNRKISLLAGSRRSGECGGRSGRVLLYLPGSGQRRGHHGGNLHRRSSPTIAQYLKAGLREIIPEGFGNLAAQLGSYREMVKEQVPEIAERTEIFQEMVAAGMAGGCS